MNKLNVKVVLCTLHEHGDSQTEISKNCATGPHPCRWFSSYKIILNGFNALLRGHEVIVTKKLPEGGGEATTPLGSRAGAGGPRS